MAEISPTWGQNTQTEGEQCRGVRIAQISNRNRTITIQRHYSAQEDFDTGQVSAVQGQGPLILRQECSDVAQRQQMILKRSQTFLNRGGSGSTF